MTLAIDPHRFSNRLQPIAARGGNRLMKILPLLTALPGAHLPLLADWAKHFAAAPDPREQLDALSRAELRARAEIRTVLARLAGEFDLPRHEVDEAMARVDDTLGDLTGQVELDLAHEIEEADQY